MRAEYYNLCYPVTESEAGDTDNKESEDRRTEVNDLMIEVKRPPVESRAPTIPRRRKDKAVLNQF
jgi:hypothetical protein